MTQSKALARLSDRELRHLKPRSTAYGDSGGLGSECGTRGRLMARRAMRCESRHGFVPGVTCPATAKYSYP
jgi:hypothetical protein